MDNGNGDTYYKMKPNLVKRLSVYIIIIIMYIEWIKKVVQFSFY